MKRNDKAQNSALITDEKAVVNSDVFQAYAQGKTTLVSQGGGQRGIFTAGVLDAFLFSNFDVFDEFYGTSAGALNNCSYLCRQPELGKSFIVDLTADNEFFNLFSYIRHKKSMNIDWALNRIREYPYKLDLDMGRRTLQGRHAYAAVTDAVDLNDHYIPLLKDNWFDVMRATCAIPRLYHEPVSLSQKLFVDGGVSASIPVQEAWRKGGRMIVVIRTESVEEGAQSVTDTPMETDDNSWLRGSLLTVQGHWQQKLEDLKEEWHGYLQQRTTQSRRDLAGFNVLNGGRWLFGAGDIYRLRHLLGEKVDSSLADMIMVHYQTYSLTLDFLTTPPDDCFVVQIAPEQPLKSSSLLSKKDDLLDDYELGLQAGYRFIANYNELIGNEKHGK